MPDTTEPTPAPIPVPVPVPTPGAPARAIPTPSNLKFYAACVVLLVVSIVAYSYINKFRETKTTLDKKIVELTTTTSSLSELQTQFVNYKKDSESKTSIIKKPFMFNGKLVVDGHGKATYVNIYVRNNKDVSSGNSATFNELSQTVTITQAVTTTVHEVKDVTSGVKIQGSAYVSLPGEIVVGKLSRAGAGVNHNFFLGSVVGLEAGSNDIKNSDPLKSFYVNMHIGIGIP